MLIGPRAYKRQRQVERMNRTLKTLTKLAIETGGNNWIALLPFALSPIRNTPGKLKLTLYETLFEGPPPLVEARGILDPPDYNFNPSFLPRLKALEVVRS